MAFGDNGRWRVIVNGVPFRADGETQEDAMRVIREQLIAAPELFQLRAKRIGLDSNDLEALRLGHRAGSKVPGDQAFAAANRGRVDAEGSAGGALNQALIGAGRTFIDRTRGTRQFIQEMAGNEAAAAAIAEMDRDERELFKKLDDAGVGMEDIGELGTDIVALLGVGALGTAGVLAAGATAGVASGVSAIAAGTALGLATVKENAAQITAARLAEGEEGFDPSERAFERTVDAGVAGTLSAVGPILSGAKGAASSLTSRVRARFNLKTGTNHWLSMMGMGGRRGATTEALSEALELVAGTDPGKQVIGRAALDKVHTIINSLPTEATQGLKSETLFATLRNATQKATRRTAGGINVFDGAMFEREAAKLVGQIEGMFTQTEHQAAVAAIGQLAVALQGVPGDVSARAASRAALAIARSPSEAEPLLKALKLATSPGVKSQMLDALAEVGEATLEQAPTIARRAFITAFGVNTVGEPLVDAAGAALTGEDE